jgi:hypothetical protein
LALINPPNYAGSVLVLISIIGKKEPGLYLFGTVSLPAYAVLIGVEDGVFMRGECLKLMRLFL